MMFDNKSSAAFGLGLDYIFAPKKFFDFLTQKIFKEFLDSGKCKLMNYTYYRLIYCNKMDMNALPKVTFSISDGQGNSNEMTLHLKDFFELKDRRIVSCSKDNSLLFWDLITYKYQEDYPINNIGISSKKISFPSS